MIIYIFFREHHTVSIYQQYLYLYKQYLMCETFNEQAWLLNV
jgi:hypothetical protein